jgi:hypothetical protein
LRPAPPAVSKKWLGGMRGDAGGMRGECEGSEREAGRNYSKQTSPTKTALPLIKRIRISLPALFFQGALREILLKPKRTDHPNAWSRSTNRLHLGPTLQCHDGCRARRLSTSLCRGLVADGSSRSGGFFCATSHNLGSQMICRGSPCREREKVRTLSEIWIIYGLSAFPHHLLCTRLGVEMSAV